MHQRIERPGPAVNGELQLQRITLSQIAERRRRLLDPGGLRGTDQRRQVSAQNVVDGHAEQIGDVGADLADLEVGLADDGEHSARLDAARDVDRLARAVVEIDGRAGRQQIVGGVAVGSVTRNWSTPRLRS